MIECDNCRRRFADGFSRGRASVYRENKSGCVCVFDDDQNIISVCDAHRDLIEDALAIRYKYNRRAKHGS